VLRGELKRRVRLQAAAVRLSVWSTTYEGPNTSFSIVDENHGTVNFTGGLAPGASTYFSLKGPPSVTETISVASVAACLGSREAPWPESRLWMRNWLAASGRV
jgi:hypothetical protein